MPLISRLMIKLSLVYLVLGALAGSMMLINKALLVSPFLWFLIPQHIEFLISGWIIQCTLGVAYWILPRFLKPKNRGNIYAAWGMLIFLNGGIFCAAFSNYGMQEFGLIGRGLQTVSVIFFISLHWNRVLTYNQS